MVQMEVDDSSNYKLEFNLDEQIELEYLDPFILLQPREIAISIAFDLYDEEKITQQDIDEKINELFSNIHEMIFEDVIEKLSDNGIEVE